MNMSSSITRRAFAGVTVILFLIGQVGEVFAQRRGGGFGGGSFNTYRSPAPGGGYRPSQPAPMTPRYTAPAPRQPSPTVSTPRTSTPSGGSPTRSGGGATYSAPRTLPKSINPSSPVATSPSFTGKVTKIGSPIITVKTGKTFSIPQQGVFTTKTVTTFARFKTELLGSTASGKRVVLQQRITQVALGKKTIVAKTGGGGGGHGGNDGTGSGSSGKGRPSILDEFNLAAKTSLPYSIYKGAAAKIPVELGFGSGLANKSKDGWRWFDKGGNGVRIDKGNPNAQYAHQQVDHVRIQSNGKTIGRDGKSVLAQKPGDVPESHIPYEEWIKWKEWDKP